MSSHGSHSVNREYAQGRDTDWVLFQYIFYYNIHFHCVKYLLIGIDSENIETFVQWNTKHILMTLHLNSHEVSNQG